MVKRTQDHQEPNPQEEGSEDGASTFAWEFDADDRVGNLGAAHQQSLDNSPHPRSRAHDANGTTDGDGSFERAQRVGDARKRSVRGTATTPPPMAGQFGPSHANYLRDQLDRALDRWWAGGDLPNLALLRDALLLLEADGSLPESQRTLLLRAALAYNRGVQTALRHQSDAERVALILAEALVEWEPPLEAEQLPSILGNDAKIIELLGGELERSRVLLTGDARRRAQYALEHLALLSPRVRAAKPMAATPIVPARRRQIRQLILILLLISLLGFVLWQQRRNTPAGMVAMPAATYAMLRAGESNATESVPLEAFFMDRFEVANRDYRRCVEQGACAWPAETHSAKRADYFTNPAFDDFPVIHVTQEMAAGYCAWQEKRLPSAAEWQAAASVSTATGQAYRFPWGATFELQRSNGASSGLDDTVVVGSFRPGGNSPNGLADMAGNAAEWTATLALIPDQPALDEKRYAVVKGGSFASTDESLAVGAEMLFAADQHSAEIGFRCARSRIALPQ